MKINDKYVSKCHQCGSERTYGRSRGVGEKVVVKIIRFESGWVTIEKERNEEHVDIPIQQFLLTFKEYI